MCVFLKSSSCMNFPGKQARCCIFWTFFVVQIRRYRFASESGLDVDDVCSCFRIFMNLLAQIPPGTLACCVALLDGRRSWIRRRLRMRRVA